MRRITTLTLGLAVIVGLGIGGLFGGVLGEESPSAVPAATLAAGTAESSLVGLTGRNTVTAIRALEEAISQTRTPDLLTQLGLAYQLRWRETGDASYLPRSETALRQALRLGPDDATATIGLGSLALIRHDFRGALRLGRRARTLAPDAPAPYAVVGDALLELGRYREAFATFEAMVARKPTLAGYARIAYARELTGDREGAREALQLALDSTGGVPEPTAWTLVEIAKLELGSGRIVRAQRAAREALRVLPGYVSAREQLARVLAAQGRLDAAIREARRSSEAIPLPGSVALLGDLLERRGRAGQARQQFATVDAIQRLLTASGIRVDLDDAVYRADRGARPLETIALARRARLDRPSIAGDDALGWALARAGRCGEAEQWLDRALRLGTKDALLFFHRGYAAGCAGDRAEMTRWYRKALSLNPSFSVQWAPVAKKALAG
jgi:tetratricopeptide (TPR) repeat protein